MKVSEIGMSDLCGCVRIDYDYLSAEDESFLEAAHSAAVSYVKSYTGLSDSGMDEHEDIAIAVLVLVSDMFDNRQMTVDKSNVNRVVDTILGMYCTNMLG